MAIVSLSRVTLYGMAEQKDAVLHGLQDLGCVHLVDLSERGAVSRTGSDVSTETHQALRFLRACAIRRRPVRDPTAIRPNDVVQEALKIEQLQQQLLLLRDELAAAVQTLEPWGDFHLPAEEEFGALRWWFYVIPHYRLRFLEGRGLVWQEVSRDHRFTWVVVISATEPAEMPVPRTQLDQRPLSELRRRLESVESELEELHWQRVALTRWVDLIGRTIAFADDQAAWRLAARLAIDDRSVFAVQGWTPCRDLDRLRSFAAVHSVALTTESPRPGELPPTLLENSPLLEGGQDAVTFYMTPSYQAWDPSGVVFVSFSVFFAMIMADMGYALVVGGLLLLLWRTLGRSAAGGRLRRLALATVTASIIYGGLIGSWFGRVPAAGSLLSHFHVIDAGDTALMMRISMTIGVVHLSLANLVVAWRARWSLRMLSSVGWMTALMGGLAFGFGKSGAEPQESLVRYGTWLLAAGLLLVAGFSSDRPLQTFSLRVHTGRLLDGFKALTNVSRAFGDVLSYLRLFALGLASAQLAVTFNDLTDRASSIAGIGSGLAVLVVILGHGLNLTLGVMSGVIHGLRLNCIEFFGWGLPDEGYPFHPFSRKAT